MLIPQNCSWTLRRILKLRSCASKFILNIIGNGENTNFWYDNWHPNGVLDIQFHDAIRIALGISKVAKVSSFIVNEEWFLPTTRCLQIRAAWQQCQDLYRLPTSEEDCVVWTPNSRGNFSSKSAWEVLRFKYSQCTWFKVAWFSSAIPRHAFLLWRLILGKLPTMNRLKKLKLVSSDDCVLCWAGKESDNHLFFKCYFSFQLWSQVAKRCFEGLFHASWKDIVNKIQKEFAADTTDNIIIKLAFQASVYHVWMERNQRRFQNKANSITMLIDRIFTEVHNKVQSLSSRCQVSNSFFANHWNIPVGPSASKIPVKWECTRANYQLATDGSFGMNGASCGGLFREKGGTLIFAFHTEISHISSIFSESMGLLEGLKIVNQMGYNDIEVQVDSLLLMRMVQGQIPFPWRLQRNMLEILSLMESIRACSTHVWREANFPADWLASQQGPLKILYPPSIPVELCNLIDKDARGFVYYRSCT
jgi:ribonuclease HI